MKSPTTYSIIKHLFTVPFCYIIFHQIPLTDKDRIIPSKVRYCQYFYYNENHENKSFQ